MQALWKALRRVGVPQVIRKLVEDLHTGWYNMSHTISQCDVWQLLHIIRCRAGSAASWLQCSFAVHCSWLDHEANGSGGRRSCSSRHGPLHWSGFWTMQTMRFSYIYIYIYIMNQNLCAQHLTNFTKRHWNLDYTYRDRKPECKTCRMKATGSQTAV